MRIKVTGYLDTDDLLHSQVDLSHEMGLSPAGYEELSRDLLGMNIEDVDFELQED